MKKERIIRLHALRQGDEVFHDSRWWQVGQLVKPDYPTGQIEWEIKRGSKTSKLSGHMDSVVRIMRSAPIKEKNGRSDEG